MYILGFQKEKKSTKLLLEKKSYQAFIRKKNAITAFFKNRKGTYLPTYLFNFLAFCWKKNCNDENWMLANPMKVTCVKKS